MFRFPSGQFFPTTGDWNFAEEWHVCSGCSTPQNTGAYNSFIGVRCSSTTPVTGCRPFYQLRAGQVDSNGVPSTLVAYDPLPAGSLKYDHWYDSVIRIKWAGDSTGSFTWYLDGQKIAENLSTPTVAVGSGGPDHPDFGILNYRRQDLQATSFEDFALAAWGPTAASVGFAP
jgi:hypothetical protein